MPTCHDDFACLGVEHWPSLALVNSAPSGSEARTVTSSAGAVPGLRTRTKYVASVPAYFVAGPRQSTSSSGLRQKTSFEAFARQAAFGRGRRFDEHLARFASGQLDFNGLAAAGRQVAQRMARRTSFAVLSLPPGGSNSIFTFSAGPVPGLLSVSLKTCGLSK